MGQDKSITTWILLLGLLTENAIRKGWAQNTLTYAFCPLFPLIVSISFLHVSLDVVTASYKFCCSFPIFCFLVYPVESDTYVKIY
jgi:hypothetical protein